ncbi:MAG: 16S rRNA (cytosine(967)-C(5))-methyltransferase RsmB [Wenzhouxiangella sp.]
MTIEESEGAAPRLVAARAVQAVLDRGQALDGALEPLLAELGESRDRSLARRLCHLLLRDWPAISHLLGQLLKRPPQRRDRPAYFVLAVSLAELREGREPDHAIVHSAVEAVRQAGLKRLVGLANAVLRNYLRRRDDLESGLADQPIFRFGYPGWLIEQLRTDWPHDWEAILNHGNEPPPLCLRVNRRHWSRAEAAIALAEAGFDAIAPEAAPDALILHQRAAISALPGFAEGGLSVQDGAAQLTVDYLELIDGQRVLDACAAPGGKAAHILERADVDLTALDIDGERLGRVAENLERLSLTARLVTGDASKPSEWWDGQLFDRILIDAPCSATGVIRRHPDIRWLRKPADVTALVMLQAAILDSLWPLLAPGGILVYATCSVLNAENRQQANAFLERHEHLEVIDHADLPGRGPGPGRQIMPGDHDLDGFYHLAVRRLPVGAQ